MTIPDGISGEWEVRAAGNETVLIHHTEYGSLNWMTNSLDEKRTNKFFHDRARGKVLIAGLGIGYNSEYLAGNDAVTSITIVEKEVDVISLVATHVPMDKTTVVHQNILAYMKETDQKYDIIFFDIFPNMGKNDFPDEVAILDREGAKILEPGGEIIYWESKLMVEL